jgi:sialic acid synthase SpsE
MVEKHVKLGDLDWIHFDGVAIDLYDKSFNHFVKDIRKAEIMCGKKHKVIQKSEHHKYQPNKNHN